MQPPAVTPSSSSSSSSSCCRVSLKLISVVQCIVVVMVFGTLISLFAIEFASTIEEQVTMRMEARLDYVREAVLKPFTAGRAAAECVAAVLSTDVNGSSSVSTATFGVSDTANFSPSDARFIRLASAVANFEQGAATNVTRQSSNGKSVYVAGDSTENSENFVTAVAQVSRRNDANSSSSSYSSETLDLMVLTVTAALPPYKVYKDHYYASTASIMETSDDAFAAAPTLQYHYVYNGANHPAVYELMVAPNGVEQSSRSWYIYPDTDDDETTDDGYVGMATYSIILGRGDHSNTTTTKGVDFSAADDGSSSSNDTVNATTTEDTQPPALLPQITWLVSATVNLSLLTDVLGSVTDGRDSYASLYDVKDMYNPRLISTTMGGIMLVQDSNHQFYDAGALPESDLDGWFVKAMKLSWSMGQGRGGRSETDAQKRDESGVQHVDGRFISHQHIYLGDEDELHLFVVVSTDDYEYFEPQRKVLTITISVGVVFTILTLVGCIAIVTMISYPIAAIDKEMHLAALLRNDQVVPPSSFLSEIDVLCKSFAKMNDKLLMARAFMPASMLVQTSSSDEDDGADGTDDEEGEEDDDRSTQPPSESISLSMRFTDGGAMPGTNEHRRSHVSASSHSSSRGATHNHHTTANTSKVYGRGSRQRMTSDGEKLPLTSSGRMDASKRTDTTHNSSSAGIGGDHSTNDTGRAAASIKISASAALHGALTLKSRRVAVLCINVRGFTDTNDYCIGSLPNHATALTDLISAGAVSERGIIDSFHGDHFVISFNAVKTVGTPGKRAVAASITIANSLAHTPYKALSMGASCSTAFIGPLGNNGQRRLSIVGNCYTRALRLQRASAAMERGSDHLFSTASPDGSFAPAAMLYANRPKWAPANVFGCLVDNYCCEEAMDLAYMCVVGLLPSHHGSSGHNHHGGGGGGGRQENAMSRQNPSTSTSANVGVRIMTSAAQHASAAALMMAKGRGNLVSSSNQNDAAHFSSEDARSLSDTSGGARHLSTGNIPITTGAFPNPHTVTLTEGVSNTSIGVDETNNSSINAVGNNNASFAKVQRFASNDSVHNVPPGNVMIGGGSFVSASSAEANTNNATNTRFAGNYNNSPPIKFANKPPSCFENQRRVGGGAVGNRGVGGSIAVSAHPAQQYHQSSRRPSPTTTGGADQRHSLANVAKGISAAPLVTPRTPVVTSQLVYSVVGTRGHHNHHRPSGDDSASPHDTQFVATAAATANANTKRRGPSMDVACDEWMYEVQDKSERDPLRNINTAIIEALSCDRNTDVPRALLEVLKGRIAAATTSARAGAAPSPSATCFMTSTSTAAPAKRVSATSNAAAFPASFVCLGGTEESAPPAAANNNRAGVNPTATSEPYSHRVLMYAWNKLLNDANNSNGSVVGGVGGGNTYSYTTDGFIVGGQQQRNGGVGFTSSPATPSMQSPTTPTGGPAAIVTFLSAQGNSSNTNTPVLRNGGAGPAADATQTVIVGGGSAPTHIAHLQQPHQQQQRNNTIPPPLIMPLITSADLGGGFSCAEEDAALVSMCGTVISTTDGGGRIDTPMMATIGATTAPVPQQQQHMTTVEIAELFCWLRVSAMAGNTLVCPSVGPPFETMCLNDVASFKSLMLV